jgi:RimJ/RimL family protein N-acetyltransferase
MLQLTPFSRADFALLAAWFSNQAALTQWGGTAVTYPLGPDQLEAMLPEGDDGKAVRRSWMVKNDDGISIGHAQLLFFDWRHANATLGRVAVAPQQRGKGLARPMLELVITEGFNTFRLERLELNVYSFNTSAIRTYENLGFTHEGVRRSSVRVGAKRWDTVLMGLLRDEWPPADKRDQDLS